MTDIVSLPQAGYASLTGGGTPFSSGVVALKNHALVRVRLRAPTPMAEGLVQAASYIKAQGRPLAALAACELRSPKPMTFAEFEAFNRHYIDVLLANGFPAEPPYPLARSNVAPYDDPPSTNTLFAFTYTVATTASDAPARPDFLISGVPDLNDGPGRGVFAENETGAAATEKKAALVFDILRARTQELGGTWSDVTGIQIYTDLPMAPLLPIIKRHGLSPIGITWYPAFPPVEKFLFEADVRAVSVERTI